MKKDWGKGPSDSAVQEKAMNRIRLCILTLFYLLLFFIVIALDKENVLRLDDSIEGIIWSGTLPVFLLISFVLVVWVYRGPKRYRGTAYVTQSTRRSSGLRKFLEKDISEIRLFRIIGAALLVVVPAFMFWIMTPIVIGIYVNFTATNPIVIVADEWRVRYQRSTSSGKAEGIPQPCSKSIGIRNYEDVNFRYYCIERPFGLPVIKMKSAIADSGILCIKGRESSVGAVIDHIVIMPDEGLNTDAMQLRCAQLFSDT